MVSTFSQILPEQIYQASEILGGRCTGRFLALNAMENRVYDVEFEDNTHVIIKFYRPGRWSKDTILAEHEYLYKALEAEIPVVPPLKNEKGDTLFEQDGVFFALFPKKPGRLEPELNEAQLKRLGHYLARLHNVGDSFKKAPRLSLTPKVYGTDSLKILKDLKLLGDGLGPRYEQICKEIIEASEAKFKNVQMTLIHGDCHAGNILWKMDEPFFIDFDDMLYAPAVQDFWMLIGGEDEYAMKNRDILVRSYESIREFNDDEFALIEPLRALRLIYFAAWIGRRWEDGAFKLAFPHFGTERYWQEQIDHLSIQRERICK